MCVCVCVCVCVGIIVKHLLFIFRDEAAITHGEGQGTRTTSLQ